MPRMVIVHHWTSTRGAYIQSLCSPRRVASKASATQSSYYFYLHHTSSSLHTLPSWQHLSRSDEGWWVNSGHFFRKTTSLEIFGKLFLPSRSRKQPKLLQNIYLRLQLIFNSVWKSSIWMASRHHWTLRRWRSLTILTLQLSGKRLQPSRTNNKRIPS